MTDTELKLKCFELANCNIVYAKELYEWVKEGKSIADIDPSVVEEIRRNMEHVNKLPH